MSEEYTTLSTLTLTAKRIANGRVITHLVNDICEDLPLDMRLTYPEMIGVLGSAVYALTKKVECYQHIEFDEMLYYLIQGYGIAHEPMETTPTLELVK